MLALRYQLGVSDLDGAPLQVVGDLRKVLCGRSQRFTHFLVGRSVRQSLRPRGLPPVVANFVHANQNSRIKRLVPTAPEYRVSVVPGFQIRGPARSELSAATATT